MSHDRKFFDTFMLIIGALVLFSVAMIVLSEVIGGRAQESFIAEDPAVIGMTEERIAPFGRVVVEGAEDFSDPPPAQGMMVAADDGGGAAMQTAELSGEAIYNDACSVCHTGGIAGSPRIGDVQAWAPRIAKGIDTLYANAINGYVGEAGVMPARGGRADLSDEAVQASVDHMVAQSQ